MTCLPRFVGALCIASVVLVSAAAAQADEVWVAPTHQADVGGLGIGSNGFWPVTPLGAVRLAWAVPDDLLAFESAKVVLIPHSPGGAATLNLFICAAQDNNAVAGACAGPFAHAFTGVANQLLEVDVSAVIAPRVGNPGKNYLAVVAYTTPTTTTDHLVGLRFAYDPVLPIGVPTLAANTFTGTQTAPAFVGNGSGLTNLPVPSGVALLGGNNTFSGVQTASAFVGGGSGLTNVNANLLDGLDSTAFSATVHGHDVSQITNAARLAGGNIFTGTQTINSGNLDLDHSSATTGNIIKNGSLFLHSFGSTANVFVGRDAGNLTMTGEAFFNTGLGFQALFSTTTGEGNMAGGAGALRANTTGTHNTGVGVGALASNSTGFENVAVGAGAGRDNTGSNNIYIGSSLYGIAGESNTIYLGRQGTQTRTVIAGIRGITTASATAVPVLIDVNGQLGTISSSRRYKEDIRDMADISRRLFQLRPVTFRYTQAYGDGSKPMQFGLVAEEVAEVFPELAVRNANGEVETVHYETLNVLLVNELQRQEERIEHQERRIEVLEQRLNELLDRSASVGSSAAR